MTGRDGALVALRFLTRLPVPGGAAWEPDLLGRAAVWFPATGAVIGAVVAGAVWIALPLATSVAALAGLVAWVWVTGALHLDGLADVADGLGAAHGDRSRLLAVMRDPHIGSFGVIAVVLVLLAKFVLLERVIALAGREQLLGVILIGAWARLAMCVVAILVPPLADGRGARFAQHVSRPGVIANAVVLAVLSAWLVPSLLVAVAVLCAAVIYWRWRVGGITGDCLGATAEVTEALLLAVVVVAATVGG